MSRSYKKSPFTSWVSSKSMKAWRTQENRRLRHNAKQLINTCEDYDNLIIPILNDYDTLWGSPQDGRKCYQFIPLLNQCQWDEYKHTIRFGENDRWHKRFWKYDGQHYRRNIRCCRCYTNKRNWYWKSLRK